MVRISEDISCTLTLWAEYQHFLYTYFVSRISADISWDTYFVRRSEMKIRSVTSKKTIPNTTSNGQNISRHFLYTYFVSRISADISCTLTLWVEYQQTFPETLTLWGGVRWRLEVWPARRQFRIRPRMVRISADISCTLTLWVEYQQTFPVHLLCE